MPEGRILFGGHRTAFKQTRRGLTDHLGRSITVQMDELRIYVRDCAGRIGYEDDFTRRLDREAQPGQLLGRRQLLLGTRFSRERCHWLLQQATDMPRGATICMRPISSQFGGGEGKKEDAPASRLSRRSEILPTRHEESPIE